MYMYVKKNIDTRHLHGCLLQKYISLLNSSIPVKSTK